jgi:hypothetical protein
VHPRESDLIVGTHGRGIWIVDDITPLRNLTQDTLAKDVSFLQGRNTQQRLLAQGGWTDGDGTFVGQNPPDAALITYYQKKRHVYGRMKIEVFDSAGKLVDTLPANSRLGISRVQWSMRMKAPKVPPAASAAGEAIVGPRLLPGTYTVKMTRGTEVYTTKIDVQLDSRATYTIADRKLELDATMRVYALLGDLTFDVDRINAVHAALLQRAAALGTDPLAKQCNDLAAKVEDLRKKIVATTEGGAITGEERIREKTAQLYGALVGYEGRPADYYVARIDSLTHDRQDVVKEFDTLATTSLKSVNTALAAKKLQSIQPITREAWDKMASDAEGGGPGAPSQSWLSEVLRSR